MTGNVWLHIGTPKSGTSSLQKYLIEHGTALAKSGLTYVAPGGKTSANDLAIAHNKKRDTLDAIAADLNGAIESCKTTHALISSEMLYGIDPSVVYRLLPALNGKTVNVLVYLRRQDRYIEAMFLQKSKNGRFQGSIDDYIAKFQGSGSDYHATLQHWRNHSAAQLVPRVMEPERLVGGNVVTDALAQIGVTPPAPVAEERTNISPGYHRVQLLQAAARAGIGDPRKIQRQLSSRFPQLSEERGPIMSVSRRKEFLDAYAKGNEAMRQAYFPDYDSLFDFSGLDEQAATGIPHFTPEQITEITRLLDVVKAQA